MPVRTPEASTVTGVRNAEPPAQQGSLGLGMDDLPTKEKMPSSSGPPAQPDGLDDIPTKALIEPDDDEGQPTRVATPDGQPTRVAVPDRRPTRPDSTDAPNDKQ